MPDITDRTLAKSAGSRSASSTMRSAVGTRLTVLGRCRRTASTQPSTVNRSSSAIRRPSSTAWSTRNKPPRCTNGEFTITTPLRRRSSVLGVRLVVLRPLHDPLEHRVAEVDALRRAGRAAREHPHRHAGKYGSLRVSCAGPGAMPRRGPRRRERWNAAGRRHRRTCRRPTSHRPTREVERFEVGADRARRQCGFTTTTQPFARSTPSRSPTGSRPVAQHHAYRRSGGRRAS